MRIIGHRGAAGLAPENSLAGLHLADELGLWAIEVDIQLTRDGVPVLLHDHLLDCTTNASGFLRDYDYAYLCREVRLSNGEPPPRLEQALDLLADNDMLAYLEVLSPQAAQAAYELAVARLPKARIVISSFHHTVLRDLKTDDPALRTMALLSCNPIDPVGLVRACNADEAGVAFRNLSLTMVQRLQAAGIDVYAWTVNAAADKAQAAAMGVDGLFTDYPASPDVPTARCCDSE